jgi:hypothetical protein
VVIAARPAEVVADAAGAVLGALRAEPAVGLLRPEALSEPAVAAVARSRLGAQAVPAFVRACHELTAGNPFLVGELVRAIAAEGLPADEASAGQLRRLAPEGVSAAVLSRLSRLSSEARAVALAVVVLEPHAEQRYVMELAGIDEAACAIAVDALIGAEILAAGRPLSFGHPLIHAAIEAQVGGAEWARMHNRCAGAGGRGRGLWLPPSCCAAGWRVPRRARTPCRGARRSRPSVARADVRDPDGRELEAARRRARGCRWEPVPTGGVP